jgi:subtilisin family serine protease
MRKILFILVALFCFGLTHAQYSKYIIKFTNKTGTSGTLNNPSVFLSAKSIARRTRYNIGYDSTDLPVVVSYLDSLKAAGAVTVISYSKWLNQALISTTDAAALIKINKLSFIQSAKPASFRPTVVYPTIDKFKLDITTQAQQQNNTVSTQTDALAYGSSYGQVHIHKGETLHNLGFQGQGITIAILDAGFNNYTVLGAFDSLRKNKQILGEYDFVKNETSVTEDHPHGMWCFSIMAANIPGSYVGTAPKASYYLFRTEDAATEFPIEEHHWVVAAEKADSLGVDMISSSLGYSTFDDPSLNHSYADMNGKSTMITIGADLAAKKGILVCNSAGNDGTDAWKYIIAPSDGFNVMSVGAVNVAGVPAAFTSYGPSADGRIKPNVASVGQMTYIIQTNNTVVQGSGTSFSNPNMAGLIACLWQAFPEFNNLKIIDAVQKSCPTYATPNDRIGYGIPDMQVAYTILLQQRLEKQLQNNWVSISPNPVIYNPMVLVKAPATGTLQLQLTDMIGRSLFTYSNAVTLNQIYSVSLSTMNYLPKGIYNLRVMVGPFAQTIRLVK